MKMSQYGRHMEDTGEDCEDFLTNELLYVILLLMNSKGFSRIVIILNGEPIGIITTQDMLPVNLLFGPKGSTNLQASDKASSVPDRKRTIFPSSTRRLLIARDVLKSQSIM